MTAQRFPRPSAIAAREATRLAIEEHNRRVRLEEAAISAWTPTDEERAGWGRGGTTLPQEATESETGSSGPESQEGR